MCVCNVKFKNTNVIIHKAVTIRVEEARNLNFTNKVEVRRLAMSESVIAQFEYDVIFSN